MAYAVPVEAVAGDEHVQRLRAIAREIATAQKTVSTLTVQRQRLIEQLKDAGVSITVIARDAGLTPGRVHQLLNAKRPAAARLLAHDASAVQICYVGDVSGEGEELLHEAAELVAETARGVELEADVRADPSESPSTKSTAVVVADAVGYERLLDSRKSLGSRRLSGSSTRSRTLHEPGRSRFYRSGIGDGDPSFDIGYIGPLTTQDSSLCVAGIYPAGALGAAAYLRDNLAKLYKENRTQQVGLILRVELDSTGRPTGAAPLDQLS